MPGFERTRTPSGVQGASTPFWLWAAQRGSGLLLGPLVLIHVAWPGAPHMALLGVLLLAAVLVHGCAGLWRLAGSGGMRGGWRQAGYMGMGVLMLVLAVLGSGVIASLIR